MSIKSTGKALALSVFLHLFVLVILLGKLDFSVEPKIKINDSSQKSTARITYINIAPKVTISNQVSIPQPNALRKQQQIVQPIKPEQAITSLETAIEPTSPELAKEVTSQPLKTSKYYTSEEVLVPAQPVGDWVLETNTLLSGRVYQIFIQIWILETGEFEKFELIESSVTDDIARLATLNLLRTPMAPATQDGKPVASTRKLAILIDKDE